MAANWFSISTARLASADDDLPRISHALIWIRPRTERPASVIADSDAEQNARLLIRCHPLRTRGITEGRTPVDAAEVPKQVDRVGPAIRDERRPLPKKENRESAKQVGGGVESRKQLRLFLIHRPTGGWCTWELTACCRCARQGLSTRTSRRQKGLVTLCCTLPTGLRATPYTDYRA